MMWDFRTNQGERDRSRSPQPPSFPVPQTNASMSYAYSAPAAGSSFGPPSPIHDQYITRDYLSVSPSNLARGPSPGPVSAPASQTQFPATQVIHIVHHHHKKHKHKKQSSKDHDSEERGRHREKKEKRSKSKSHSRDPHQHSLSHSYSTSHLNITLPVAFPTTSPNHHTPSPSTPNFLTVPPRGHRHSFSHPQVPTQPLLPPPSPRLYHKHSANVLQKPRPTHQISHSHSVPIVATTPQLQPQTYIPNHGPKPLHGILKPSTQQRPEPLAPHFQYSRCTGRKRALCIGINYHGQSNALRGCVNDARHVREFLIKGGYHADDIFMLTDEPPKGTREGRGWDSRNIPTRENIIRAMKWLVRGARQDDSLFFHYSGHGGQTRDKDGDEIDGWDEVIFPYDFSKAGHITDDEMHDIMVKPLPPGCRLTGLFDACHSGTVLDLPYIYSSHGRLKGSHIRQSALRRKATSADVISWSGCRDDQTSSDTFAGGVAVGAMSYAFITSLNQTPSQTYQQLLRSVRHILLPRFSQKPQLGSSHHIDTNLRFIF